MRRVFFLLLEFNGTLGRCGSNAILNTVCHAMASRVENLLRLGICFVGDKRDRLKKRYNKIKANGNHDEGKLASELS